MKINMRATDFAEVLIYEDIGLEWGGLTARTFAEELQKLDVKQINVRINSSGGNVFDGVAMYNTLKRHKASVTVDIDGAALSIASVIAMAGETISMAENAFMMIHDPWGMVVGGAEELRHEADLLDEIKDSIVSTYASRTGNEYMEISQMMAGEKWMSATDAVEMGFADTMTPDLAIAARINDKFSKTMPKEMKEQLKASQYALHKRREYLNKRLTNLLPKGNSK